MDRRKEYLEKADLLKPALRVERVRPVAGLPVEPMAEGDSLLLDFGNHHVGHVTLKLNYAGSHPDAPVWLRLKFCESPRELNETVEGYKGWISKGWIQEEQLHIDVLPCELSLPRRYAFRYLRVEVLAVSLKFRLVVEDAWLDSTTSADDGALAPFEGTPEEAAIDRVAVRTLRSCMQDFFEDGPKRDRRLWLGDLRLQALTSYATFHGDDLVKRCLYLFAAAAGDDGQLTACLFTEPKLEGDDNWMADYALLFISTLKDYVAHTGDLETGRDLLPVALRQLELSESYFDPQTQLVRDGDAKSLTRRQQSRGPEKQANMVDQSAFFIDWNLTLNKQAAGQAVWIYCARDALRLMALLHETDGVEALRQRIEARSAAAVARLYDGERGLFVSGADRQVSWASQVWFALADVLPREDALRALKNVALDGEAAIMVSPYMMHHYVDALYHLGCPEKAHQVMMDYWGGMVRLGADTFFELYNPANPDESPYGSPIVNSYCHAWSCTPAYFLRGGAKER